VTRFLPYGDMDKILSLSKRRGFVFQSSEVYGGLGSTWDYGPLGVELKRNVKEAWWRSVILERDDMVGLDAAILMHPQVWVASGHVENFSDPLVDCRVCNERFRADQVWAAFSSERFDYNNNLEQWAGRVSVLAGSEAEAKEKAAEKAEEAGVAGITSTAFDMNDASVYRFDQIGVLPSDQYPAPSPSQVPCPSCAAVGRFTDRRQFNLMFKTFMGPVEETANEVYLRPETAQGIFVNFPNVVNSSRKKLPFGIGQIGKAFRNEITPGNFTFRTREFEQMEVEYFVKPGTDEEWLHKWVQDRFDWYVGLGIRPENLRLRQHASDELAHYAKDCYDIEYRFPWGWAELEGIADRTDFDLRQHAEASGQDMTYFDDAADGGPERYFPYVIEPSGGVDRAVLAFWLDAYDEEPGPSTGSGQGTSKSSDAVRVVLHLHRKLAPVTVAALPLSRNDKLVPTAQEVYRQLRKHFNTQYDDAQSIGRRYRRQDEIGTPYCVTIDFDTLDDHQVTIRDRDTMHQTRIPIADLVDVVKDKLEHGW